MTAARRAADAAKARIGDALGEGRRRAIGPARRGPAAVLAMQRAAGNSAVGALLAARFRGPSASARTDIDAALHEVRGSDPEITKVEKGLKAAQALGIPVVLEGPKPPASALAVTTTGFGPEKVPARKPPPPPKKVPAKSPLGKAGARAPKPAGGGGSAGRPPALAPPPPVPAMTALTGEQLLQPPVPPTRTQPDDDPAFRHVTGSVKAVAKAKRAHAPATAKAAEAQGAALPPTDDVAGQAKAAKVDTMDAQKPGTFDKKAFIAAVKTAIEQKSPKTLKEADNFKESGKAGEVKGEIKGLVGQGKEGEAKDVETASAAAPDESKAVPKQVTPMSPEQPGSAPAVPAAGAAVKPAPPEQVNLAAGKHEADKELADGEVTEKQLAESNEPQFQQALTDKQAAAQHADTAPGEYRKQEAQVIEQHKVEASAETAGGVASMQSTKTAAVAALIGQKAKTKSKDETKRAEVTAKIQAIYAATETDVKKILDGIDPKVEAAFEKGEAGARAAFENYVSAKMSAYKEDRYSGWLGGLRWAKDKLLGMPDKVNEFYTAGRELYLQQMDVVISQVADIVGNDLTAAKQRIAAGKNEITTYVTSLPRDLKKVGAEAANEINERFEDLEKSVDEKQDAVVDTLATKYTEARKGLDDRIEELQAENKGLVAKAIDGIKAVVNTIRELVSMLKNVLARVAGVIGDIIAAPVRFIGGLIEGVKGGILQFKDNILSHLKKGLLGWLFGTLAEGGVELPESFDLKGIIGFLASLFGLTWRNIRNRIVRQIGEKAMSAVEKGVEIFSTLATAGIGGLWQMLVDKLGDIKDMIIEQVKDFVVTKIITAGITWLISLLNPVAAFIKACKLIYDVIMFFVNNASRIMAFVNTVIDSTAEIVKGNIGGVVNKVEEALGRMVPILIGFLASVLGIGGIGEKIRSIVEALRKPVNKALDFVIKQGLKLAGPIIRGLKGIGSRAKAKVAAGKAWVKGRVEAGKTYVKGRVASARDRLTGKPVAGTGPLSDVAAAKDHLIKKLAVKRPLTMRGRTHQIYTVVSGGRPHVMLASTPEAALGRLEIALAHPSVKASAPTLGLLSALRTDLLRLQDEMATALGRSSMPEILTAEDNLTTHVGNVVSVLNTVGEEFDITDLKGTQWTTPEGELRPEFRVKGRLRAIFYGSGYQQHTGALLTRAHDKKQSLAATLAANPMFAQQSFYCPGVPGEIPPHLALDRDGVQADHVKPVAWHWNEIGRKSKHAVRVGWNTDIESLQALCPSCNRRKNSLDEEGARLRYNPKVEPGFEGPP